MRDGGENSVGDPPSIVSIDQISNRERAATPTDGGNDAAMPDPETAKPVAQRPLHILVAEDYQLNQKVIKAMLQHLGHRVSLVENGLEAVSAVLRWRYDLILMDIHMPELDGNAATRRIRALPRPEGDIPIIALTADTTVDQRRESIDAGVNEFLTKPVNLPELLQAMARCTVLAEADAQDQGGQAAAAAKTGTESETGTEAKAAPNAIVNKDVLVSFGDTVGWDTVTSLFDTLAEDFAEHRKIITKAAGNGEFELLSRQIQALNGALGQFGATKAQETALAIEVLCKAQMNEMVRDLIEQFLQLCDNSIAEIRKFLATRALSTVVLN